MNNDGNKDLNIILGQLEDELRQVKSAREQVDSVSSAAVQLSTSLEGLIDSSRNLIHESNERTREAVEALLRETNRLSGQADMIEAASKDGLETIHRQATDAQTALEKSVGEAIHSLTLEAEQLAELSKSIERSSTEASDVLRRQATDAQATLEKAAETQIENASSSISVLTEQVVTNLGESLDGAQSEMGAAIESLNAASSSVKESQSALLRAHEDATEDTNRQISETRTLLEETQKHLSNIDERIETLEGIDIDSLVKELRGLSDIEEANAAMLKKQLASLFVMVGACLVICAVILVKLFVS